MPKEWILNNVMNRFQLNFKKNVGATSESIRKSRPSDIEEWRNYYYSEVRPEEHIDELGKILFEKISTVIKKEIDEITEQDCIDYIKKLVINRTFDGYMTEIDIVRKNLEKELDFRIEPAPDDWDRTYGVDFFIKIKDSYIGIQIKPEESKSNLQISFKYPSFLREQHRKFTEKYRGKCFVVFSIKKDGEKVIQNKSIVESIKEEIRRLRRE